MKINYFPQHLLRAERLTICIYNIVFTSYAYAASVQLLICLSTKPKRGKENFWRSSYHFCENTGHFIVLPASIFSELLAIAVDPGLEMKASFSLSLSPSHELTSSWRWGDGVLQMLTHEAVIPRPVPALAFREGTASRAPDLRSWRW